MIDRLASFFFSRRTAVIAVIALTAAVLGSQAFRLEVVTSFADLQPTSHPYVQVHEEYKESFGGANVVTLVVEPVEGDIFQLDVLEKIQAITRGLQQVDGVDQFQIISLASKHLKEIRSSTYGIETESLMWPDLPKNQDDVEALRQSVVANRFAYGSYVSRDLKAALITVDFIDRLMNYEKVYAQINQLVAENADPDIRIRVIGEPMLYGTVSRFLPETVNIAILIVVAMLGILFLTTRTWRGTLLPMASAIASALISLGIVTLMDFSLDPLIVVIVFLISARAISHSVQFCIAFDEERRTSGVSSLVSARNTFKKLLRPSVLGLLTDIGAILVVAITPIPLLQKAALLGAIWVSTMLVTAVIMVPVALSGVRQPPEKFALKFDTTAPLMKVCRVFGALSTRKNTAAAVIATATVALALAAYHAMGVTVGDANPGSPILWPDSQYNRDSVEINKRFPGSDRGFVVVRGEEKGALQQPEVLNNMERFQRFVEAQPQIGGSISLVDVIASTNMVLHEGNPRFDEIGSNARANAELLFMYQRGAEPGDISRLADLDAQTGAVTVFLRDRQGDTVRTAIARMREYIAENPMPGAQYELIGGRIGITAAVNEVIFSNQLKSIALALMVLFIFCAIGYRSAGAGLFFLPLILLSNAITFAFMKWQGIGVNINTLPIAALGIGLGVDYAFYIVDRIKERFDQTSDIGESIRFALETAGRGVITTGATMVLSVLVWFFLSSLRFQAEMGILISLWMTVSALAALLIIPAMVYLLQPSFVVGRGGAKSPQVCRRFHLLRESSDEITDQRFPGVPAIGCSDAAGSARRV